MRKIVVVLVLLTALFMCVSSAKADITQAERDTAIARGLRWLAAQQYKPAGYFENPDKINYFRVALTAFAVLKFEDHATRLGKNPFDSDYEYHQEVEYGWDYLSTKLFTQTPLNDQSGNDPEQYTDNDDCGIYFNSGSPYARPTYETGIVMMALQASASPSRPFPNAPSCAGTFKEVLEDCVDWYAWAQCDKNPASGFEGRGGWRYLAYDNASGESDNSVSQWPVLGFMAAEAWGINAPDFVRNELETYWLAYSQDAPSGCFWYRGPGDLTAGGHFAVTAAGLVELTYCGVPTSDSRWSDARQCICENWDTAPPSHPGHPEYGNIHNLYAMYALMKAAMTAQPEIVWDFGEGCPEWQPEYDDTLLAIQDTTGPLSVYGSWPASWALPWNSVGQSKVLATEYALLILQKVAPPPPPPEGGTVIIPNKVFERFGFGHWDYFCWQETIACDNRIEFDDACPPYWGINPGDFFEIPIVLDGFEQCPIGGFELEVEFDYIDLTFYGAMRGGLLERRVTDEDDVFWSWEYFTYRVLPCNIPACHKYKILLFGQADMPDGQYRRGYCLHPDGFDDGDFSTWWYVDVIPGDPPDTIGATLAWLKFQVANNELLRDLKLPIFFEWEHKLSADTNEAGEYYIIQDWDCAENTFSNCDGNVLYVSNDPLQYNPDICSDSAQYPPLTILEFVDGGVHICSPCTSFKCVRGDINLDHIVNSTADAVLFARYFVEGIHVFVLDRDEQVCATDVNADGRTLMLSDLVYLIRIILQDAVAIPKLAPSSEVANVIVYNNTITTECASPIGAILFEFDASVVPTLLATNMEMVNKENKVLVWSRKGESFATAEVLSFVGEAKLVSVTAVDRDSRELSTSFAGKTAPISFALNPAYPNPFNPFTNLSFTLPEALAYSLKIYNVAGQLVRSYEGMGSVGLNLITWDGKDNAGDEVASGVYFYKLSAVDFSATKKMVVLK